MANKRYLIFLLLVIVANWSYSSAADVVEETLDQKEVLPRDPIPPPIQVNGKTFVIETFFNASWYRAGQFCRLHGMHLASITSKEENDKIGQVLTDFGLGQHQFFLSGNDLDEYSLYVWQSTGSSLTYTNFRSGEPNHRLSGNETEHCLEIDNIVGPALWNDVICSLPRYFICQLFSNPISGLGRHLFYLSGNDLDEYSSYVWQSTGSSLTFTNFKPGEPNHSLYGNETEHCLEIDNAVGFALWNDVRCSSQRYFICQL